MYRCPVCGSDKLEVLVEVWATLSQNDDGAGGFETDTRIAEDGGHEWSDNSLMHCLDCGADEQIADAFKTREGT